ncbi:CP2 transcription factor-domain-containing protein [Podospora fimiseda]|uniref:CP2 transcription factor-domain-containing protein n=1 Tax=Podospora fimiseda TaxID=252190 RepID=A0AAN7BYS1_9PEZI|nr:CP2 transcription factor-domain-containing protein [Podospora fimiseda]
MFSQRTSSRKPGEDLLQTFRQQFPEVAAATTTAAPQPPTSMPAPGAHIPAVTTQERAQTLAHEAFRDQDPTPRAAAANEPWRFTPSLLDPGSFSFATFGNPGGYYTPTPGGTNTLYHPRAGDLHTPTLGLGMGLNTPLSLPTSQGGIHSGTTPLAIGSYHDNYHSQPFQQPFHGFLQHPPPPQPSFAPSTFLHQDTGYETMDQDGSPIDSDPADERMGSIDGNFQSPLATFHSRQYGAHLSSPLPPHAEKFRFHTALNAPTAMIRHHDEIPVTYLNKGQAYNLSIVDTQATLPYQTGTRYRTFVRVSFEDEQQRQKPGVCWSLWKEGRGTNEAHQRGGKLQAVEYVETAQPADGDDKKPRIELETSSFDGFSVIWTPGVGGAVECNISVRFNFLSTDFSHSKGVKGIPVRLCAKTHPFNGDGPLSPISNPEAEICYCKVKLFRDHGAERKLSNDVAHVRKTIDKLKQQIAQAESGIKDFGKRKRPSAQQTKSSTGPQRPGKIQKHKRTWSMSSASSAGGRDGGPKMPLEEDLHAKLQTLQDMFTSTRPVSVLYLRGDEIDDPDLHPVSLPGETHMIHDVSVKMEFKDGIQAWRSERGSVAESSLVSPSPSSLSLASHASVKPQIAGWGGDFGHLSDGSGSGQQPTKVRKISESGHLTGWIEALGVDSSYRPPPERLGPKPVASFYVARVSPSGQELYRAVYLVQRSVPEFVGRLAGKYGLDASRVSRIVRSVRDGVEVEIDEDVVRELREGQDMLMEIVEVGGAPPPQSAKRGREWEMAVDGDADGEADDDASPPAGSRYEIKLRW